MIAERRGKSPAAGIDDTIDDRIVTQMGYKGIMAAYAASGKEAIVPC